MMLGEPLLRRSSRGGGVAQRAVRRLALLGAAVVTASVVLSCMLRPSASFFGGGGVGTGSGGWRRSGPRAAHGAGGEGAAAQAAQLSFPVWWLAPFYSGSGYGSEAVAFVAALVQAGSFRPTDVWVTHAGDAVAPGVVKGMQPADRQLLQAQEYANLSRGAMEPAVLARRAIAVCHNFMDCWGGGQDADGDRPMAAPGCPCPPPGGPELAYVVGRTMWAPRAGAMPLLGDGCMGPPRYETAGLPSHLVQHCNNMDEVWVPTEFNRQTFAAAGVDPGKLRVVEEVIDTTQWDPAAFKPLDPLSVGPEQICGPPRVEGGEEDQQPPGTGGSHSSRASASAKMADGSADSSSSSDSDSNSSSSGAQRHLRTEHERPRKPFVFLSIFKLEARKGWDVLLDAFLSEFGPDEGVELHIFTRPYSGNPKHSPANVMWRWLERAKSLDRGQDAGRLAPVYVSSRHIDDHDYPRLYLGADAVVLPTRGEGWGRPQMEAMAMARPLISTNWSGTTAYLSEAVAYPLAIDGLSPASEDMNATDPEAAAWNPWFDGQLWARPSTAHLRALMRRVVTHPDEAAARGRAARRAVLERFSPAVVAARVRGEVERIQAKLAADPAGWARRASQQYGKQQHAQTEDSHSQDLQQPQQKPQQQQEQRHQEREQKQEGTAAGASPAAGGGQSVRGGPAARLPQPGFRNLPSAALAPGAIPTVQHPLGDELPHQPHKLQELARAAAHSGFSHAGGVLRGALDPVTQTLREMLLLLDQRRHQPRTRMQAAMPPGPRPTGGPIAREQGGQRLPAPAARHWQLSEPQLPWPRAAGAGPLAGGGAAPEPWQLEGPDDGSIVLHR